MSKLGKARKASNPADSTAPDLEVLDELAKKLDPQEMEHEHELRRELEAVEGRLCVDRCEMGRILTSYRTMYNPKRGWRAFCKAVGQNEKRETVTTFQEQGARWLESLQTRKRKPVALSTTEDWERILSKWLNPHIGSLPLAHICREF